MGREADPSCSCANKDRPRLLSAVDRAALISAPSGLSTAEILYCWRAHRTGSHPYGLQHLFNSLLKTVLILSKCDEKYNSFRKHIFHLEKNSSMPAKSCR